VLIGLKVGVTDGVMTTFIVVEVAQTPAAGVKVYVCVPATTVEIVLGLQVPFIPLVEIVGNNPAVVF
jgi:hypothetical protein